MKDQEAKEERKGKMTCRYSSEEDDTYDDKHD